MDKVFAAIISLLTVWISIMLYRHTVSKDKHQLIIEFGNESDKNPPNKLVIEKLFSTIFLTKGVTFHEIERFLKLNNPLQVIDDFKWGRRFNRLFEIVEIDNKINIQLSDKYNTKLKIFKYAMLHVFSFLLLYSASIAITVKGFFGVFDSIERGTLIKTPEVMAQIFMIAIPGAFLMYALCFLSGLFLMVSFSFLTATERLERMNKNMEMCS